MIEEDEDLKTQATTPERVPATEATPPARGGLPVRVATGVVAAVLVVLAVGAPIWRSNLSAPQYPDGLRLVAYGDRVEGDLREVENLNHYVGMRSFRIEDFPEMALWVPTLGLALAAVAVAVAFGRRWPGRLARLALWLIPVGALADVQLRLYQFGHDLDPGAAIRLDAFTPLAVGPTKVLNFTALSFPGEALLFLWGAALVLSVGPWLVGRILRATRS